MQTSAENCADDIALTEPFPGVEKKLQARIDKYFANMKGTMMSATAKRDLVEALEARRPFACEDVVLNTILPRSGRDG